jgi:hypothetical protein
MKVAQFVLAAVLFAVGASSVAALDRRVRINNYTSYDIIEFYASHRDATSWQ